MKYEGKKTFIVTGDTYSKKDKIRKAGGKWDKINKVWEVELYSSDSLWRYEGKLIFTEKTSSGKEWGYKEDESSDIEGIFA